LNTQRDASDPWGELANAIVEQTADDYRRNMTRLIKRGLSMSEMELVTVQSYVTECKIFFESDWGDLLSHGLADVIWEKLQAEFADDLAWFEARLPYMQKHRRKLDRKRKATQRRWAKNKSRRKRQRKFKNKVAAICAAMGGKEVLE
jgi:hypothetical protein